MYMAYLVRQEENRGTVDVRFDGYTNVLVLGLDDAVNTDNIPEHRADAILLISFENATGKVRLLNIPRDTWVRAALDKGEMRLGSVYTVGGAPLMVRRRVDLPLPIFPVKTNQLCSFIFKLTLSNKTLSLIFKEKLSISMIFIICYHYFVLYLRYSRLI